MRRAGLALVLALVLSATACGRDQSVSRGAGLCGDANLSGTLSGHVPGATEGCGIARAVRLEAVHGVRLSRPATLDCPTARTLGHWVAQSVKPAVGRRGGGLEGLEVAAHYVCRTRNHRPGAPVSEHGKGRAIDISALHLADGSRISVLEDWGRGPKGRVLARVHRQACGPFGTVLGPNSDRFHRDHLHLDTARHRGGPYCR